MLCTPSRPTTTARDDRQVGIVARDGRAATFTGSRCIAAATGVCGNGFAAQGNCLASVRMSSHALATTFTACTSGHLADRHDRRRFGPRRPDGRRQTRATERGARHRESRPADTPDSTTATSTFGSTITRTPIEELARILELAQALLFSRPTRDDVRDIDPAFSEADLVRELVRVGALAAPRESYDEVAAAALVSFMHVENLENRVRSDGRIDRQTLDYLLAASTKAA